jgi:hypothetical protein
MRLTGVFDQFSEDQIEEFHLNASHVRSIIQIVDLAKTDTERTAKLVASTLP